ncbi:MAG TPA: endonuclease/exonuclease/phosphatase family protein [Blastocatellia bacterium]|nr:endonuclease/exonuclease/phosphatase family protein [Blastocatellia bacterium]
MQAEAIDIRSEAAYEFDRRPAVYPVAAPALKCISINTHRGQGPKLPYLLSQVSMEEAERIQLLHHTRVYTYYIAEWLNQKKREFDVVGLQEVFNGVLGFGDRLQGKFHQRDHYRVISGFRAALPHGVGFAGFRYENLLLSQLQMMDGAQINYLLPGKVYFLAACGFTLAPFVFDGRIVWIGNTHLHPYSPKERKKQAISIASEIRKLNGAPVLFLGDFNTVPPGCRDSGFPAGERDVNSYRHDETMKVLFDAGLNLYPHEDSERFYTYPTGLPNRTLDYILFSDHWEVLSYEVAKDFKFSDHYPVSGEFRLRRQPRAAHVEEQLASKEIMCSVTQW